LAGEGVHAPVICINASLDLVAPTIFFVRKRVFDLCLLRLPLSNLCLNVVIGALDLGSYLIETVYSRTARWLLPRMRTQAANGECA